MESTQTKGSEMFDKRFKRIRIFTALPRKAFGLDVVTPHGPLFMVGRGRDTWKPSAASTGHAGITCYSVGIGPLWAVYTRKRLSGGAHVLAALASRAVGRSKA